MRKNLNNNSWVMEEIISAVKNGIPVKVNGISYNDQNIDHLEEITELREDDTYMKDYVGDDNGKVVEIIFDKIKITK